MVARKRPGPQFVQTSKDIEEGKWYWCWFPRWLRPQVLRVHMARCLAVNPDGPDVVVRRRFRLRVDVVTAREIIMEAHPLRVRIWEWFIGLFETK